jgi:hypothetical protein
MDPEWFNKSLEFILQIWERIHKIEGDGTDCRHRCGAGGV